MSSPLHGLRLTWVPSGPDTPNVGSLKGWEDPSPDALAENGCCNHQAAPSRERNNSSSCRSSGEKDKIEVLS